MNNIFRGPFLETPDNFPGPVSIFSSSFTDLSANGNYWRKLSQNKNCIAIREYCAPKIVFGPENLSGVSRNGPQESIKEYYQRIIRTVISNLNQTTLKSGNESTLCINVTGTQKKFPSCFFVQLESPLAVIGKPTVSV